ncbi:MAG: 4-hydroxy-3-methylbut-2-enyl diphosphate reductase [Alphaproteobacteria bacterium]|nr:4-hydroxy-3-methylbut-2-enyl diphosphate reductase [Alphaproteobacteria bacterium]
MREAEIFFAQTYGFCGGVIGALRIIGAALHKYGAPIYVYHKIVHNERVVSDLENQGVIFIDALADMQDLSRPLVLSAHGSSLALVAEAENRGIKTVIDSVCPLVKRIHEYVRAQIAESFNVIVIGNDEKHDEVTGTMGQSNHNIFFVKSADDVAKLPIAEGAKVCFVGQTTLSRAEFEEIAQAIFLRFPEAECQSRSGVCAATSQRQQAVWDLVQKNKLSDVIVIGSSTSSNTKNLAQVARDAGAKNVWLVGSAGDIDFPIPDRIGITAGASTPQILIDEIVAKISAL